MTPPPFSITARKALRPRIDRPYSAVAAATTVMLAATLLIACGKKDQAAGPGGAGGPGMMAVPVSVIEVQPQRIPIVVETVGQTVGSKEVEVRPRVSGILLKQLYKEGDVVKAGAPLFQIDPATYDIALMQGRASLAQAGAGIEQAKREASRLKPLVDQKAISQREYDEATSTQKTSEAGIMAAQAQVNAAKLNLGYTKVTAPIAGVTGRAQHSEGSLVQAGTDLLTTISVTDPIWVAFSMAETESMRLRQASGKGESAHDGANQVKLVFSDGSIYETPGKLNFAASTVDPKTGTVQLRAEFPNPKRLLLPGQFVRAQVTTGEQQAFLVPQNALMQSDLGKVVFTVTPDNKVAPRPVETSGWSGNNWIVTKGLNAGDKVIVDNLMKLRPGALVSPHPPGQMPGPPGGAPGAGAPAAAGGPASSGAAAGPGAPSASGGPPPAGASVGGAPVGSASAPSSGSAPAAPSASQSSEQPKQ